MLREIKVGGAALNQTPLDWANNLHNISEAIRRARAEGIEVLCLPELAISGYGCEDMFLAPWVSQKSVQLLMGLLPETKGITVAIGLPVYWQKRVYNCAALVHDGQLMGITAKQHLANDGLHYETRWFTPWPSERIYGIEINGKLYPFGDNLYNVNGLPIGIEICEDAWQGNQRPAMRHMQGGAQIILGLNASHFAFSKTKRREQLVCEGCSYKDTIYVYTNLLGNESGRTIYDGEIIVAQNGHVMMKNTRFSYQNVDVEGVTVIIDHPMAETAPSLEIEPLQSKEQEFTSAAVLGLYDYLRKSRSRCFVLSLSGGADSSCCAVLVAEMIRRGVHELGAGPFLRSLHRDDLLHDLPETEAATIKYITRHLLYTAYQGTVNSSDDTRESARELAASLGSTHYDWNVDEAVGIARSIVEKAIGHELTWEKHDLTLQNVQARARSPIIWMLANLYNGLLLATGNRSEGDVGYATMDGDTSGSISPIAGVDKHFVRSYLKWAEAELGYSGLSYVNNLEPSAELRPLEKTQTDEADLMPYSVIVEIERLFLLQKMQPHEIASRLHELHPGDERVNAWVEKFFVLWSRNQWKRERFAPGFHFDDFNIDPRSWCRFPILSGGFREELKQLPPVTKS